MNLILLRSGGGEVFGYVIMSLIVGIIVFLILREVACWYWKINERIELQQKQIKLLEELIESIPVVESVEIDMGETSSPVVSSTCKKCRWENKSEDVFCSNCGNKL